MGDASELDRELKAWEDERNTGRCELNWHFTTTDARVRLRHLYPPANASAPFNVANVNCCVSIELPAGEMSFGG